MKEFIVSISNTQPTLSRFFSVASHYLSLLSNRVLWIYPRLTPLLKRLQSQKLNQVGRAVQRLSAEPFPHLAPSDWVVLCLCRDALPYLDAFFDHHRNLGAAHFVFIDNGSSDGTSTRLLAECNTTVFTCKLPFARYETQMRNWLLENFGKNRWSLVVDIDEFFEFPNRSETGMQGLLSWLDTHGFNAMLTSLLDLFENRVIAGKSPSDDQLPFRDSHLYYDLSAVKKISRFKGPSTLHGGIRAQAFGCKTLLLSKHSLLRYHSGMFRPDPHWLHGARVADITGVLLHYKFISGFSGRVDDAVSEGNHYRGSLEYKSYQKALNQSPNLNLCKETARPLRSIHDLVDTKFLEWRPLQ